MKRDNYKKQLLFPYEWGYHIITIFTMYLKELFISLNVWFLRISSKTQKGKVSANYRKLAKSIHETLKISENLIILYDRNLSKNLEGIS